jgi:hypothetical protein
VHHDGIARVKMKTTTAWCSHPDRDLECFHDHARVDRTLLDGVLEPMAAPSGPTCHEPAWDSQSTRADPTRTDSHEGAAMSEPTGSDRRLERLEERIHQLEQRLEEYDLGGPGPKYYESGTIHPELDDQTIAP